MDNLKIYRRKSIFKALILPILITAIIVFGFIKFLPVIENRLPNGPSYVATQQENKEAL